MNTLHEIMVIRDEHLRCFQVDDFTLSRLTCVRGNLFRDDLRLRPLADMPKPEPAIPEHIKRLADAAFQQYMASKTATASTAKATAMPQPQPERPQTPEDAWRCSPALRQEFTSLASYQAYLRAVQEGRCKAYGGV